MIDYGGRRTDLAVKRAEGEIRLIYQQAAREIEEKTKAWREGHARRDAKYRQMVKDGKMSKADYESWMRGQVFQEKQWKAKQAQIQATLLNADKAAMAVVNQGKLGVFAVNANYIGYELEHDSGLNTGFVLYDENTVARLIRDNPKILPMLPPEKAVLKDKAYTYYNRLMNRAITQGIIQGESIQDIAFRIAKTTGESSYKSAMRNARTAYTGAQNAGRIEGLHQAQALGIKVKKRWLATLDSKTRDSHATLDGQVQEVDDPFESPLGNIMYPGDTSADDPADIWNCRCTLTYVYPEYPSSMQRRDAETGEVIEDMTYREWEQWKATRAETQMKQNNDNGQGNTGTTRFTQDEKDAIRYWKAGNNGWGYADIRAIANGNEPPSVKQLRENHLEERAEETRRELEFIERNFESAVMKCPDADGEELIRITGSYGIPGVGRPVVGAEFELQKFESFSAAAGEERETLIKTFGAEDQIVFRINGTSDFKDISEVSNDVGGTAGEKEVLTTHKGKYQVVNVNRVNYGGEYIDWLDSYSGGIFVTQVDIKPVR